MILVALTACGYADPRNVCTPPTLDDACPAPPDTCTDDLGLQLAAIQPSIANPGDTIMLEGKFSETEPTNVIFPGGAKQRATVIPGGHRASVNVPGNAKTGDLFVKTGPYCLGGARFRSASFGQQLQLFVDGPRLTIPRTQFAAVVVNDSLYVLGGDSNGSSLTSVERAPITTSGLGSFEPVDDTSLTTARAQHTIAVVGNWLYVLGGIAEQPYALASIERAQISSDGRLGPFEKVEKELRNRRLGHSSVVIGNRLYVLGGVLSTTGDVATTGSDIEYATIAANGDLDKFVEIPPHLPKPIGGTVRSGTVSVVFGNSLYVLGGYYRSPVSDGKQEADVDALKNVDKASILRDCSIGEFQPEGAILLSVKRAAPATAVIGRHLYLFGGFNFVNGVGDNYLQSSERAEIVDGSLTSFDPVAPLGKARGGAAAAVVGNSICVLGGQEKGVDGPPRLNTVECAASPTAE